MAIAWCFQLSFVHENLMLWSENLAWPHHALERPCHDGICGASQDLHLLYSVIVLLNQPGFGSTWSSAQSCGASHALCRFLWERSLDDAMMVSLEATDASAVMNHFWNVADFQANAVLFFSWAAEVTGKVLFSQTSQLGHWGNFASLLFLETQPFFTSIFAAFLFNQR